MMLTERVATTRRVGMQALLFGGLLVAALGCREGTTEPGDDRLALDEAVAMFEGVRAIEQDSAPRILNASDDSVVVACPIAGRLRVTGRVSESVAGDTLKLETDFTFAPADCRFSREELKFTIDGDPGIRDHTVVGITFEDSSGRIDLESAQLLEAPGSRMGTPGISL